jgi:hypothetical protein
LSYEDIKELKRKHGLRRIGHLLALAENKDPFYKGSPLDFEKARWFLSLWQSQGCAKGMHLRRVHYRHVVEENSKKHDGKPYENTEECWDYLCECSKAARALRLVEAAGFDDHRNPDPYLVGWWRSDSVDPDFQLPHPPEFHLPEIASQLTWNYGLELDPPKVLGYERDDYADRSYILEVWIEKSTMNDILVPLCRQLGVNLIPAAGMQSWSNAIRLLERCQRYRKPARLFYISDFDPAGDCMPVAVSRTLEFFGQQYTHEGEIKLTPLALTAAQAEGLPRIPIKTSDLRRAGFEATYGEGAVELDALEALRPGQLAQLVREAVRPYVDRSIGGRLEQARDEAEEMLATQWTEHTREIAQQLETINHQVQLIAKKYRERLATIAEAMSDEMSEELAPLREQLTPLHEALAEAYETFSPELPPRPEPEIDLPDESDWLFDSSREYMDQLAFYKQRKNGKHGEG